MGPSSLRVAAWMLGGLFVLPAASQAQAAGSSLPVSLARIRAGLEAPPPRLQPPPTTAPAAVATFRVEVSQPFSMTPLVEEGPGDPTMGIPSAAELLMGGIGKIHSAVAGYKRGRAKKKARKEVQDAMTEFCAVNACPAPSPHP